LALTILGAASVKEISKFSNVAREAVYRVLPRLQKLGLVEKEIVWPTRFSAITLDDAVTVLLGRRNKETLDLKEKVKLLLRLKSKQAKMESLEEKFEFLLVPAKKMLISKIGDTVDRAQKCICIVTSNNRLLSAVDIFSEAIGKALSRGVKFRIVTSNVKKVLLPAILEVGNNGPCIEIRYVSSDPRCAASIIDGKEVLIITKPTAEFCESPALWSNNSSLVNIVEEYFEILWMAALEKPEFSINGDQK
jgi:sugar-specific transcriptional regulator TrmB